MTHFAQVLAAIANQPVPLDAGASKVLHFMLEREEGCDARITRDEFTVAFGWNPGPHRYFKELAPGVVSELLAGIIVGPPRIRARLPPRTIPAVDRFMSWSFGPRTLWLDASDELVAIAVRANAAITEAFPTPIKVHSFEPVYLDLELTCPHCSIAGTRYRELSGGRLVCPACARSFDRA